MDNFEFLIPIVLFGVIGWIVHTAVTSSRHKAQLKATAEFQSKILEKMGSPTAQALTTRPMWKWRKRYPPAISAPHLANPCMRWKRQSKPLVKMLQHCWLSA